MAFLSSGALRAPRRVVQWALKPKIGVELGLWPSRTTREFEKVASRLDREEGGFEAKMAMLAKARKMNKSVHYVAAEAQLCV